MSLLLPVALLLSRAEPRHRCQTGRSKRLCRVCRVSRVNACWSKAECFPPIPVAGRAVLCNDSGWT